MVIAVALIAVRAVVAALISLRRNDARIEWVGWE
jgi:hypothetical protein